MSIPPICPPYLEAARDAAMLAYLRSESDDRGARICHANNLSVYWSGADPFEAERTPAVHLPRLLGASDIAEVHQAAAGRICGEEPVGISPVGDSAYVEGLAAAAGAGGSTPAPAQWQRTGERPPLAELLRRRRATEAVCAELTGQPYDVVYSPEHVACYLHREAMFSKSCPRLLLMLVDAMTREHPGLLPTKVPLHVRCVELHAYSKGGALLDADHRDNGSKRTLIVQLSEVRDASAPPVRIPTSAVTPLRLPLPSRSPSRTISDEESS